MLNYAFRMVLLLHNKVCKKEWEELLENMVLARDKQMDWV